MRSITRMVGPETAGHGGPRPGRWCCALAGAAVGISLALASPATAAPCTVDVDVSRDADRLPSACAQFALPGGRAVGPVAAGGDGRLWFLADAGGPALMRVDISGSIQRLGLRGGPMPTAITRGPDGNIWYVRPGAIGVVGPNGPVGQVSLPGVAPSGIVGGPDGALWFPAGSALGRATTGGAVSYIGLRGAGVSETHGITVGPDGALWIAAGARLARVTVGGAVTALAAATGRPADGGVAGDSDGALWYSSTAGALGRVAPSGAVSAFALPAATTDVVRGPGRSTLWAAAGGFVARVSSDRFPSGQPGGVNCRGQNPAACLSRLPGVGLGDAGLFNARGTAAGLAVGPDGNLWYSAGAVIGRVLPFRGARPCYQRVTRNTAFGCGRTQSRVGPVTQGGQAYLRTSCPRLTFRYCLGTLTLRAGGGRRIASARYLLGSYDNPKVRVVLPRRLVRALRRRPIAVRAVYDSVDAGGIRRVGTGAWTLRLA